MDKNLEDLEAQLKSLADAYASQLPQKIEEIEQFWQSFSSDYQNPDKWHNLFRMAHNLAGSSGSFGFSLVSDIACQFANSIEIVKNKEQLPVPGEEYWQYLDNLMAKLKKAVPQKNEANIETQEYCEAEVTEDDKAAQNRIAKDPNSPRILIIEDDVVLLGHYCLILRKAGVSVEGITMPSQTMEYLENFAPDLIILDLYMPGYSGFDLASMIRRHTKYEHIPILFLSMETDKNKHFEAIERGADGFLTKPIKAQELLSAVKAWLAKAKRQSAIATRKIPSNNMLTSGTRLPGSGSETYVIQNIIGQGGMGVTYTAIRLSDKRKVAVKTLLPEFREDTVIEMRFLQEARIISGLEHDNLVRGYDFCQNQDFCYLVMEFIEGRSLRGILQEETLLAPVRATRIVLDIARGLQFLEANELVHRDIKPDNIIIDANNTAKLVDFGLGKVVSRSCSLTSEGIAIGTPHYISPEQIYQSHPNILSDIYSLGATYFHMVTGEFPFKADNVMDIIQRRLLYSPQARTVIPTLPKAVNQIISKMMMVDMRRRPQSTVHLIEQLEKVLQKIS